MDMDHGNYMIIKYTTHNEEVERTPEPMCIKIEETVLLLLASAWLLVISFGFTGYFDVF